MTAVQKGDRARAFLNLYEQHQDLILAMPIGGRPLNTPLNLTNVKRDDVWDMLFTVAFKVGPALLAAIVNADFASRTKKQDSSSMEKLVMTT